MILLVASSKDVASLNIKKQILAHYSFKEMSEEFHGNPVYEASFTDRQVKLVTINEESIYAQDIASYFGDLDLVVFISRHSSESGTPTLSVHTPGNLGEAKLGGLPQRVSISPANAMRDALKAMIQLRGEMQLNYEVSYECTHHGPSLDVPAMFAECGSSAVQWNDTGAVEVVAHAAMRAISQFGRSCSKAVLGIGGLHYNAKFTKMASEEEIAFSHMIPKHALPTLDRSTIEQCVRRTFEKVDHVVLDWKGIKGEDKPLLIAMLGEMGVPYEKA